jgi:hypothetical protein
VIVALKSHRRRRPMRCGTPHLHPGGYLPFATFLASANLNGMLADQVMTVGTYATAVLGGILLLLLAIHAYAWWTIRHLDRSEDA